MTGVQLISGRGGWPMSSFLNADGQPFHGGTYFPPEAFDALLEQIATLWDAERDALIEQGHRVAETIAASVAMGREAREVGDSSCSIAPSARTTPPR